MKPFQFLVVVNLLIAIFFAAGSGGKGSAGLPNLLFALALLLVSLLIENKSEA